MPLSDFKDAILDYSSRKISLFLKNSVHEKFLQNRISTEISDEIMTKAEEMLGPSLSHFHAARLSAVEIEMRLNEPFFIEIFSILDRYLEGRLMALSSQIHDICLQQKSAEILGFECLDGDPHNGLYRPLKIALSCNGFAQDYVYKSVSPYPQDLVHKIGCLISSKLGIGKIAEEVPFKTRNSYLRYFAKHETDHTKINLKDYFFSFGVICSIASILEISDLHFENIIVTRDGPQLIDVEFLLNNSLQGNRSWNYVNSGLFQPLSSPIAQLGVHKHLMPFMLEVDGRIRLDLLREECSSMHLIYDRGVLANPMKYVKEMQMGAIACDDILRSALNEIQEFSNNSNNKDVRILIRSTSYYRILQMQLWLPCGEFKGNVEEIRGKLHRRETLNLELSEVAKEKIIAAELLDLCRGDIPYFWIDGFTGELMHSTGCVVSNFCLPVNDVLRKKVRFWSKRSSVRDISKITHWMMKGDRRFV